MRLDFVKLPENLLMVPAEAAFGMPKKDAKKDEGLLRFNFSYYL